MYKQRCTNSAGAFHIGVGRCSLEGGFAVVGKSQESAKTHQGPAVLTRVSDGSERGEVSGRNSSFPTLPRRATVVFLFEGGALHRPSGEA